jgi:hypothetical protein
LANINAAVSAIGSPANVSTVLKNAHWDSPSAVQKLAKLGVFACGLNDELSHGICRNCTLYSFT